MTLIELLVVIIILTTIVAAAIPILAPADDDRRLREASRGLNTFITGAQARAIGLHRPYGVALKRLSQETKRAADNGVCLEVFYVEQQPPYSGFDANSRVCVALHPDPDFAGYVIIQFVTRGTQHAPGEDGLPIGWDPDVLPGVSNPSEIGGVIRPGDVLETNGSRFELVAPPNNEDDLVPWRTDQSDTFFMSTTGKQGNGPNDPVRITARPLNDSGQMINPRYDNTGSEIGQIVQAERPYWTSPAPYKILRQATPTSDEPYQLPEGTAIDLRASGVGISDYFYVPNLNDNDQGVQIMFAPEGRVARVTYSQWPITNNEPPKFDEPVVDNVFLLVGRRDRVPSPDVTRDATLSSSEWNKSITEDQRNRLREPINWLIGHSRWVVIGSQSGRVATVENAFVDAESLFMVTMNSQPPILESTEPMRNRQILAARKFTSEMTQTGGR